MSRLLVLFLPVAFFVAAGQLKGQACNLAPVAVDDTAGHLGAPLTVDVLANDLEPEGEALSVEIVSVSSECLSDQVAIDHGHVRFTPEPLSAPKNCTVTYRIWDERGGSATAVLTMVAEGIIFMDGFESGNTAAWVGE